MVSKADVKIEKLEKDLADLWTFTARLAEETADCLEALLKRLKANEQVLRALSHKK